MKRVETEIYENVPDKPGVVKRVGFRKAIDVFEEIKQRLSDAALLPEEYFLIGSEFSDENSVMPEFYEVIAYAVWGGSEGTYLEIDLIADAGGCTRPIRFITGKTLNDDRTAHTRMQYIAGVVYEMLMGDHQVPARYFLTDVPKREQLSKRIDKEYREFTEASLISGSELTRKKLLEVGLRSLIVAELPKCTLPEDKVEELLGSDNALDLLTKICAHILEADTYEINDTVSACRSILDEVAKI